MRKDEVCHPGPVMWAGKFGRRNCGTLPLSVQATHDDMMRPFNSDKHHHADKNWCSKVPATGSALRLRQSRSESHGYGRDLLVIMFRRDAEPQARRRRWRRTQPCPEGGLRAAKARTADL